MQLGGHEALPGSYMSGELQATTVDSARTINEGCTWVARGAAVTSSPSIFLSKIITAINSYEGFALRGYAVPLSSCTDVGERSAFGHQHAC